VPIVSPNSRPKGTASQTKINVRETPHTGGRDELSQKVVLKALAQGLGEGISHFDWEPVHNARPQFIAVLQQVKRQHQRQQKSSRLVTVNTATLRIRAAIA
jgi:hypothetical protein